MDLPFIPVGPAPFRPSAWFFSLGSAFSVFPGALGRGELQSPDLVQQLVGLFLLFTDLQQLKQFNPWLDLDVDMHNVEHTAVYHLSKA